MASVLDGGDSWGNGCGHSSGGVSESGVSVSGGGEVLGVGLGVSLTLDQMGWSSGAVGGGDVLADLLVIDVLVGDVDGVADGLRPGGAGLGLDHHILDLAVGSKGEGQGGSGQGNLGSGAGEAEGEDRCDKELDHFGKFGRHFPRDSFE